MDDLIGLRRIKATDARGIFNRKAHNILKIYYHAWEKSEVSDNMHDIGTTGKGKIYKPIQTERVKIQEHKQTYK